MYYVIFVEREFPPLSLSSLVRVKVKKYSQSFIEIETHIFVIPNHKIKFVCLMTGFSEITNLLINKKRDSVRDFDIGWNTPLHVAAPGRSAGRYEVAKLLKP